MKLLMISTDRGLLDPTSAVSERFRGYAALFTQLDVIVFARGTHEPCSLAANVHVHPTNSSSKLRYIADATRIGRRLMPDVVSGQDPFETGLVAWRIARIHRVPLHLQVHTDVFSDGFRTHSVLNRVRSMMATWLLPRAAAIRVVSDRVAASLRTHVPRVAAPITVLPIAVQVPHDVTPEQFPFAQTVLMVSRLESEKRVAAGIEAFARIAATHPDVGLVIAGDGSQRTVLTALVTQLGLERHVRFVGSRSDVANLYAGADVFVQLSVYEGYGMTLVEAALAGLPIVTTDVGVVGELLVDGGSCLVTSGTPRDVAQKLELLLADEPLRQVLGGRAREAAVKHINEYKNYLQRYHDMFLMKK